MGGTFQVPYESADSDGDLQWWLRHFSFKKTMQTNSLRVTQLWYKKPLAALKEITRIIGFTLKVPYGAWIR
jgi:hypothetical protein